ncbi:HAMP domain-containing histidine kinase [archaeon]|nr:MAG: HAMP domain-containing histidine kinase [archaeon]
MEDCLQRFENNLAICCARNPVMRKVTRIADQTVYHNCFITCLVIIVLYAIVCFSPLFFTSDSFLMYHEENAAWDRYREAIDTADHFKWLLVSIFVAIPMALELILDYDQLFDKYEVREGWLGMFFLILFFIAPNAILYVILCYREPAGISDTILLTKFALSYTQQFAYIIGMMIMMFGHKADYPKNDKHTLLNFSVEKRTVNASLVSLVGRLLYSLGSGLGLIGLQVIARILAIISSALVVLLTLRMLYMLVRQYLEHGRFLTHHHLSDFMYCITLLSYVSLLLIIRFYNISQPPQSSRSALNILLAQLFLQILITCFVQLISGRRNKKLALIKHEKLETRLNLIRYVSHEMRTPLNTAFMGLTLAIGDLKSWTQKMRSGWGLGGGDICASRDSNTPREGGAQINRGCMIDKLQSMSEDSFNLKSGSSDDHDHQRGLPVVGLGFAAAPMSVADLKDMIDTVGQVNESCKVALSTLDDLLTFDKIDEQKLVIEMQEINPWTFVCAAAKPFAINARQAQVHFSVNLHDRESGWVKRNVIKGDVFKLSQVLRNLISNALKFTPIEGTVEVNLQSCTSSHVCVHWLNLLNRFCN